MILRLSKMSAADQEREGKYVLSGSPNGRWPAHQPGRITMSLEELCPVHRGLIAMSGSSGQTKGGWPARGRGLDFQTWESLNPNRHLQNIAKKV
jgi:hypothetical protein